MATAMVSVVLHVYSDEHVFCRESYQTGQNVLDHLAAVDSNLKQALRHASLVSLMLHGPEAEVEACRAALAPLGCEFFVYAHHQMKTHMHSVYDHPMAEQHTLICAHVQTQLLAAGRTSPMLLTG